MAASGTCQKMSRRETDDTRERCPLLLLYTSPLLQPASPTLSLRKHVQEEEEEERVAAAVYVLLGDLSICFCVGALRGVDDGDDGDDGGEDSHERGRGGGVLSPPPPPPPPPLP